MKITRLRTVPVRVELPAPIRGGLGEMRSFSILLIFLDTDEGLSGEGLIFAMNERHLRVYRAMVEALEPLAIGLDPDMGGAFWARAWIANNFVGHKGVPVVGIAAVDMAIWDLRAKAAGRSVARLIGACHEAIPTYASGGLWLDRSIDELQREAAAFAARGFRAVKMRLGLGHREDLLRVRAVREAIGPDVALMADANQQMTASQAIRFGRDLEPLGLTWFEEPLPAYDLEGVARVTAALDTPIASGETEYTRVGFKDMLLLRSADILMPDLQRVGGVTEFLKVAHMAEAFEVPIASHLFSEMSLPVLAGLANAMYLEHMPWFEPLYRERIELDGQGRAVVPDRPGWGFALDPEAVAGHALG